MAAGKLKIEIDFTKRYDIYFKAGDDGVNSLVELKGCRFIGYVGQGGIEAPERYVYPTSSFSKGERYVPDLTHLWVNDMVLERADGRRVYIPGGSIAYFMESAP